jgi:hypothetical protein
MSWTVWGDSLIFVVPGRDVFLGYSAFGRVFRIFRCRGGRSTRDALALKIALGVSSAELFSFPRSRYGG